MLQTAGEKRTWLLKTPFHMNHLPELLEAYPDARIVHPHRPAAGSLASLCSVLARFHGMVTDDVALAEIGNATFRQWSRIMDKYLSARERGPPATHVADVYFADLAREPMGVVQKLYAHFGWTLEASTEAAMRAFLAGSAGDGTGKRGAHGTHAYNMSWFGLTEERVRAEPSFARYAARFALEEAYKHSEEY